MKIFLYFETLMYTTTSSWTGVNRPPNPGVNSTRKAAYAAPLPLFILQFYVASRVPPVSSQQG